MSLNWDLRKIENREEKQKSNPFLDGLMWATMYIGMPKLSEKNLLEFYARTKLYDRVIGHIWSDSHDDSGHLQHNFPTLDQVRDFIGLQTNATPYTKAGFFSQLKKMLENSYKEILRNIS